ncbi:PadR family transcriptional regulator [Pengzhenrongella sicca]|uniref:Helix-turn-helix transcriptional regulator n=1 Tax=Pengzhenrongella sicca TaxID=2819238 RepID=A0A8A4ZEA6_9MICO|nr:PadR family transcriptional regulator [Pengzhenrongella sicca]QTE30302.1 helix-turn-helix transcriptional regulator [Pengzhenrongella sicca]
MAQVFAHGQLRLYLLSLLESGPKLGYELIVALSDRFGGTYRPSAGTVYPRLARLEEEGLVRRSDERRKGEYALTDAGRAEIEARRGDLAALEEGLAETVRARAQAVRADVRGSMSGLRAHLAAAAQDARASAVPPAAGGPAAGFDGGSDGGRTESHLHRVDAEALLVRFRDDVRAELRLSDARGRVDQLTVDTVRTVLDSALTAVRATLR